jgi:exosortase/archaeosortase family protein
MCMASTQRSQFSRGVVLAIAAILILFPIVMLLISGNADYYLNVIFYTQKIFLIASLFLFLFFVFFKERIRVLGWAPPDLDDAVVYGAMSLSLVLLLGFLHVNFDTILRMEVLDVGTDSMSVGFGGFLADIYDLSRMPVDQNGITKIIVLENTTDKPVLLRVHTGWEGRNGFASRVSLSINDGPPIDLSDKYMALNSSHAAWVEIEIPAKALVRGNNSFRFSSEGASRVFLSSQWVYHDGKTLGTDQSYYGQEALAYLKLPPVVPPLFPEAFRFQLIIKLVSIFFLFLALFGFGAIALAWKRFRTHLLIIGVVSVVALAAVFYIQGFWVHLSSLTASVLPIPLGLFAPVYTDFQDPAGAIIGMKYFYVIITKSCSGIESLGIFILFFPLIISFNWSGLDKRLILPLFIAGIVGAFLVNVIRLVSLILIGAFMSADLALDVFHTNLGWMLMLAYFALFNELVIRCRRRSNR